MGSIPTLVRVFLCPCVDPIPSVGLTLALFALTKGQRSKRQLSKSFTVVIQPLSTRLIKLNFCFDLSHRRSTTASLETRNSLTLTWSMGRKLALHFTFYHSICSISCLLEFLIYVSLFQLIGTFSIAFTANGC